MIWSLALAQSRNVSELMTIIWFFLSTTLTFTVYDTYHPILEYSNYLILGITAALAWELPSKPVYLDEELRESYQMGNLPLLQRKDQNVSNIKYTSTNKQPSSTASNSNSAVPNANYYYTNVPPPNKNPFNRYYAVNPNHRFYYNEPDKSFYANSTDGGKSNKLQYYLSYADKLIKEFKQLTEQIPTNRPFGPAGLTSLSDTYVIHSIMFLSLNIA